jgi:hypothetical protein
MPRLIAFLRAINVGGHNVTMAELRRPFEDLALKEVERFSGRLKTRFCGPWATRSKHFSEPFPKWQLSRYTSRSMKRN